MAISKQHHHQRSGLRASQRGMSLIELLVSLALSAALMAGVVGVFVTMFQSDRSQEGVSLIQESGRFALNFLSQDLRMAGYLGCSSTIDRDEINNTLNAPPASFRVDRSIQGWEAATSDPGDINNSVNNEATGSTATVGGWATSGGNVLDTTTAMPGTDIFRIWGADPAVDIIVNSVTPGPPPVVNVTNTADIPDDAFLLLSDCVTADLVQACSQQVVGNPATLDLTLSTVCAPGNIGTPTLETGAGARVMLMAGTVYYIGKRDNVATNPPTLFRRTLSTAGIAGAPEELVEGVENMQILYGENTNNDNNNAADRFVSADLVTNWDDVVSLRITLLVQSLEDNLVPTPQSYTYHGVNYNGASGMGALPPDGRLRRIFTTTINLRNVTLGG